MRLFVAVWPSAEVLDLLDRLPRPDHPAVRWTPRDQMHVTLRFIGEVDEGELRALDLALAAAATSHRARPVTVGPVTAHLSRSVLVVPVAGLDDLGRAITGATAGFGGPPEDRPFTGHLTLARSRPRTTVPETVAGQPVEAGWDVTEAVLVRSHRRSGGPSYETIARFPLRPAASAHLGGPAGPALGTP